MCYQIKLLIQILHCYFLGRSVIDPLIHSFGVGKTSLKSLRVYIKLSLSLSLAQAVALALALALNSNEVHPVSRSNGSKPQTKAYQKQSKAHFVYN